MNERESFLFMSPVPPMRPNPQLAVLTAGIDLHIRSCPIRNTNEARHFNLASFFKASPRKMEPVHCHAYLVLFCSVLAEHVDPLRRLKGRNLWAEVEGTSESERPRAVQPCSLTQPSKDAVPERRM